MYAKGSMLQTKPAKLYITSKLHTQLYRLYFMCVWVFIKLQVCARDVCFDNVTSCSCELIRKQCVALTSNHYKVYKIMLYCLELQESTEV